MGRGDGPWLKLLRMTLSPFPSPPSRFSIGTSVFSKNTVAVPALAEYEVYPETR
jgi:hypothetical protein